jgi:RNA polymerase sigma factor (sigma-70 family)
LFLPTGSGVIHLMSSGACLATLPRGCWAAVVVLALRGAPLPTAPVLVACPPKLAAATVRGCRRAAPGWRLMLTAAMGTTSATRARLAACRDGWYPRQAALAAASVRRVGAVGVPPTSRTVRPLAGRAPGRGQHQQAVVDSFAAFYEQAKDPVYRAVLAVTGNRVRAEDATAEAFAEALARWEELRGHPDANPRAWVAVRAIGIARRWWRRVGVRETHQVPDQAVPARREWVDPQLLAALRALPRRQQAVMVLRYLCDLSPDQIAAQLGISTDTVAVHHHRARRALRAALQPPPAREPLR